MSKLKKWEGKNGPLEDGIYYYPDEEGFTHYRSVKNKLIKDPYKTYQFPNTHGFCQMFAFFLHTDNTSNFQRVRFQDKLTTNNFEKYTNNSYQCLQKIISILDNPEYVSVKNAFKNDYNNFTKKQQKDYGIKSGTSFTQFLNDLKKLTPEQVEMDTLENFKMFFTGLKDGTKKKEKTQKDLEEINNEHEQKHKDEPEAFHTNSKLRVIPTQGEPQFEAFQSIIAYCFSADQDSPYVALLNKKNIKLFQKDIEELC